ncbi:restriction endonuclease subunit S [Cupriavidus taiwanensis]|uniref:restriction endonuclease subunit S n=1 Tax=Cupriavidus taiwanensis TaxID=164546 RepID=UPI000E2E48E3|nr:restriction endonuclease subunit S [Cupriavidus taiwanensis]
MSSEWPIVKLGALASFQEGYVNPSQRESAYFDGNVKWLRATDLNDGIVTTTSRTLSDEGFLSAGKSAMLFEPGTLAISKSGTIGRLGILGDYMCGNRAVINIKPNESVVPRYLFFVLRHLRSKIETLAEGSVQKNLYVSTLSNLDVPAPPMEVQRLFADTLGVLDDRITLLRETNATLEAIAQALFKSWFVDFDPVRAKQDGCAPEGMDEATAALFPDKFEESEIGSVPKGWGVGKLEDLLILQRGFDLPASERVPGSYPIIAASGPSGTHHLPMAKAPGVVTGRSGVLGRVFLELEDYWPLNTTLWVKEFRAASPCYAYEILRLLDFASFNAGSAVPTLNRNHIHSLPYLIPPRECIDAYEAMAMTLHRRVRENQNQAHTLATLRDTLLPRLISGQLRLPEAEAEAIAA